MRRHQIGIVIGALGVDVVTARRLHADDDIAEAVQAEAEFAAATCGSCSGFPSATQLARCTFSGSVTNAACVIRERPRHAARRATSRPSSALVGPSCSSSIIVAANHRARRRRR